MNFGRLWILSGRNFWAPFPVIEAELEIPEEPLQDAARIRECLARELSPSTLAEGKPTTFLAHCIKDLALGFQAEAGSPVSFGLVRARPAPGSYRVIVAFEEEAVGRASLTAALEWLHAAATGACFDAPARRCEIRTLAHDTRLGPSTGAIVRAAHARGIPTRRLNAGSLVQLGQGCRQRRVWTAESDATSSVAEAIAQDKQMTRVLLQNMGVPVPDGRPITDAEDAWTAAQELGVPVVLKPRYGNQGRGVTTNLLTRSQVEDAFRAARAESEYLLLERCVPGADYRLLVVGNRLVAAARREPAHVIGDGRSTIAQLIDQVNLDPRRTEGHATALSPIRIDAVATAVLADQNCTPESVPAAGTRIFLRYNANLSTGGTACDVTDEVHPEVAARAVDAARAVGLDIAGVDVVTPRIDRRLEPQGGAIVEVNAGPGLRMHIDPSSGTRRDVGSAIIDSLFAKTDQGRIPTIAVTGVNGKTTTTRLIAHILRSAGRCVGMACTDGLYVDDRRISTRDCSGPQSARTVLAHPRVDAAVLETARGGILREGLGFDRCDVGIVTNIGAGDHLGLRGIESLVDLARVKQTVVEAVADTGWAVLHAADPLVAAMASACPGKVIFFALDLAVPRLRPHRSENGRAVFVEDGWIVQAEGSVSHRLIPLARVPLTCGGKVAFHTENVLAAVAACWALRMSPATVCAGLESFPRLDGAPGRFNVFESVSGGTVVVDYAHNASALAAVAEALTPFRPTRRTLVYSGFNRRDADLREMGAIIGHAFDRVILYADWGNREHADGELNALLRGSISAGSRTREVVEAGSEREALETALSDLRGGDVCILGVDTIEDSLAFVRARLDR